MFWNKSTKFAKDAKTLALLHRLQELLEQIVGVVRPRRRLGVVLHREDWLVEVTEAFDGSVVEIEMRHADVRRQRVGIDGEAVVLRRDLDLARAQILHGVIGAAMAELQLEGL